MLTTGAPAALTVNDCETGVAGRNVELPVCDAVIVQVPVVTIVTVLPETVQTEVVVEANDTVRPEEAVALMVNGAMPAALLFSEANEMLCDWPPAATVTVKLCETLAAGL